MTLVVRYKKGVGMGMFNSLKRRVFLGGIFSLVLLSANTVFAKELACSENSHNLSDPTSNLRLMIDYYDRSVLIEFWSTLGPDARLPLIKGMFSSKWRPSEGTLNRYVAFKDFRTLRVGKEFGTPKDIILLMDRSIFNDPRVDRGEIVFSYSNRSGFVEKVYSCFPVSQKN